MRAVVLLRAVPDREALVSPVPLVPDAPSLVAIHLAHSLRQAVPALIIDGVFAGPAEWEPAMREALALDLESLSRLDISPEADVVTTARAIGAALSTDTSFVIAGAAATDHGSGLLPMALAEVLGLTFLGAVTTIEARDGELAATVRGDAGLRRSLRLPVPCVLQAAPAPAPALYPKLARKLAARKAAIPVVPAGDAPGLTRIDAYGPARPVTRTLFKPSTSARPADRMRQLMAGGMAKRGVAQTVAAETGAAAQLADAIEAQGFIQRSE